MRQRINKHSKAEGTTNKSANNQTDSIPLTEDSSSTSETESSSSREKSRCRRCLSISKYLLLVIIVPPFLNYASLNQENAKLLPSGNLYDIGYGQKLFLRCEGSGRPTVILDAPTGMTSDVWALVQPQIAKHTKVCSYDRAGLGFSERPPMNYSHIMGEPDNEADDGVQKWKEFTTERMVDDLFRLVTFSSKQEKPFIFVGAELGGMIGRFYAQIYETDISDLVLIDPVVEDLFDQNDGAWVNLWFRHLLPYFQMHQMMAATGISRLALIFHLMSPPLSLDTMPEEVVMRQKHLMCSPRHLSSVVDEYHFINESMSQMQTVFMMKSFPSNVSVTVLNGNYFDEHLPSAINKAWAKSQQTLLSRIHPNSNHIVVNGADHHMMYRHPDAVTEPIRRLIKQWRKRNNYTDKTKTKS